MSVAMQEDYSVKACLIFWIESLASVCPATFDVSQYWTLLIASPFSWECVRTGLLGPQNATIICLLADVCALNSLQFWKCKNFPFCELSFALWFRVMIILFVLASPSYLYYSRCCMQASLRWFYILQTVLHNTLCAYTCLNSRSSWTVSWTSLI
jgi:hypothetical protein